MLRFLLASDARARNLIKRLHRDQGGNVMVLYVASALLLVGMLWAIIGTGGRMVQKETIQSSADAAAFSAAVIKAKGLNIIAFCNLVMAVLLAVVMLLRLIKGALMLVSAAALAACLVPGGQVLCAFGPLVTQISQRYSQLVDQLEPRLVAAMKGLGKLERGINKTFPALSLVEAYRVGTHASYQKNFGGGTLLTATWPLPVGTGLSLPTKDGTWDELCDQAVATFGRVVDAVATKIGFPTGVAGAFSGAVTTFLNPLKGVLCGSGGGTGTVEVDNGQTNETVDLGGPLSDRPLPLQLAADWQSRKDVRAYTLLTDAKVAARRRSVAVATKNKGGEPTANQLLGTAQAEAFAWNGAGAEDLWHMYWRARLVRFTFGDTAETGSGDAGGVPAGGAQAISGQIQAFLATDGAAALANQFLLH